MGESPKFVQPPHIGHLIRQEVERQGLTVVSLARMLSCSRTNIYKIFDRQSIDTDQLFRISSLLHTDFFHIYSESL
ncbi:MAG: helix-turn-helix transcriptional regulator [Bacteroidaceae bacterium]|nr:helix-turn-helix transcriptional regulator [Bacteroidaceae bacterium]